MATALPLKKTAGTVVPGPKARDFVAVQRAFTQDQVQFFRDKHKEYGDFYRVRLGPIPNYVVHDPEVIEEVLVTKSHLLQKDIVTHDLEELLGLGLLTSEGDFWKRQRRLAAPSLKRKQIQSYAETMVSRTHEMLDEWDESTDVEVHEAMMDLTLKIVINTLFGLEGTDTAVSEPLETAMNIFHVRNHTLWRFVPKWMPTHHSVKFTQAVGKLDTVIYELIRRRRASGEEGDDLLHRLIIATDDDGNQMSDKQLRDEALTMFLAGHETTALALSYSWHVLSEEPEILGKLQTELAEVVGDRDVSFEDTMKLPYMKAFIHESLRMYPPAWMIGRQPIEPVEIGGALIEPGSQILMPMVVLHRDPRWFDDPNTFRPERWLDGLEKRIPKYAYFPFGGGTRVCIGNHFAMMELLCCLATMVQRVSLKRAYHEPLRMQPAVTLRPVTPMHMTVEARHA